MMNLILMLLFLNLPFTFTFFILIHEAYTLHICKLMIITLLAPIHVMMTFCHKRSKLSNLWESWSNYQSNSNSKQTPTQKVAKLKMLTLATRSLNTIGLLLLHVLQGIISICSSHAEISLCTIITQIARTSVSFCFLSINDGWDGVRGQSASHRVRDEVSDHGDMHMAATACLAFMCWADCSEGESIF